MKPFPFNVQVARRLWQRAEQEALEQYSASLETRRRALERLDAFHHDLCAAWTQLRQELAGRSRDAKVTRLRHLCRELEEKQLRAQAAVDLAERAVNEAREKMNSARRNRETVESHFQDARSRYDHV